MDEFQRHQQERIAGWVVRLTGAAKAAAELGWPEDPSLVPDLLDHAHSPRDWMARHPEWAKWRWGLTDPSEWDWDAIDFNPWSYLQDCLGIRGLAVVIRQEDDPSTILRKLSESHLDGGSSPIWVGKQVGDASLRGLAFVRSLAESQKTGSDRRLVHLIDLWSEDAVVAVVRVTVLDQLSALAVAADNDREGLVVL